MPPVCAERAGASACFYIDEKAKESSETFYSLTRIILWEVHSGQTSGMREGINSRKFSAQHFKGNIRNNGCLAK